MPSRTENIFCRRLIRANKRLIEDVLAYENELGIADKEISDQDLLIQAFKDEANVFLDRIQILKLREQNYRDMLTKPIYIPKIDYTIRGALYETFTPYKDIDTSKYDIHYADLDYFATEIRVWKSILTRTHAQVKKALVKWKRNISDCDNWAYTTLDIVSMAFTKAGSSFGLQGALGIAWSKTHAYNLIVDEEKTIWVYEPQTNKIIGKMDEMTDETYISKRVYFMT